MQALSTGLRRRPLLACVVCFLLGIAIADLQPSGWLLPGCLCMAAVIGTLLMLRRTPSPGRFSPAAPGEAATLAALLFLGMFLHAARLSVPRDDISRLTGAKSWIVDGTVVTVPETRWERQVFRVRVAAARSDQAGPAQAARGLAIARVKTDLQVKLGDVVRLEGAQVRSLATPGRTGDAGYRRWLRRQGVTAEIRAQGLAVCGRANGLGLRLTRFGVRLRDAVAEGIGYGMRATGPEPELYAQLLMGMVYGLEATPLPESVVEEFRRAGTVHLLVVSGAQVTMLVFALLWLTGARLQTVRWWQVLIAAAGVLVLALIVGLGASVARAAAMFALFVIASLTSRDYDLPTAIGCAALVICLFDTNALFSTSLQLTCAATIGVAAFLPRPWEGERPLARPARAIRSIAWATVGAWVMVTPLLAHYFSHFALVGNLANLVNVPLSGVTMVLGFLALPVALLAAVPGLAWLKVLLVALCWLARMVLYAVMGANSFAAALPVAYLSDCHLTAVQCVLWYVAVAVALLVGLLGVVQARLDERVRRTHPAWLPIGALCLVAVLLLAHGIRSVGSHPLEVAFLPVGGGQCVVVQAPSGATMMVDCGGRGNLPGSGPALAGGVIGPYLRRQGIQRLDFLVITHWDADHYNALAGLLDSVAVGLAILPPELPEAKPPEGLRDAPFQGSVLARAGATLHLGEGVSARLLAPYQPYLRWTRDDANNNSVVMRLTYQEVSFLFTGDLQEEGLRRLVRDLRAAGGQVDSQVLQLPHHGRPVAGIGSLLDAVRPRWAVASCDEEAQRYLSWGVRQAVGQREVLLLRTDLHGTVTFTSDGRAVRARTSERAAPLLAR